MLDNSLRRIIDPPLTLLAWRLVGRVTPNQLTLGSFAIGLGAVVLIALECYWLGLVCIALNRLGDGLDGILARLVTHNESGSDFGGFLDLVCDFLFYAAVAAAFGLAQPEHAWVSLLLITSFVGTGSSFVAYAAIAEKRKISRSSLQHKALHYLGGLTEGTETIFCFVLCCLFPHWFWLIGLVFALMCLVTLVTRCWRAKVDFA